MATTDRLSDDVFIRVPEGRTVTVEYDRELRFLWWTWTRRVRRAYRFAALPLYKLLAIQMIFDDLRASGRLGMVEAVAAVVGTSAFELPRDALDALWDAYCEANRLPKGEAAKAAAPATENSSGDSKPGPSTSPAGPSSE